MVGGLEGLGQVLDVGLQCLQIHADGLRVLALLEDREPVAARGDEAVRRYGVGLVAVDSVAPSGRVTPVMRCPAGFVGL